ncbi:MAG: hypothetical protein ACYTHK_06995 [Planctomycetota bacterium]
MRVWILLLVAAGGCALGNPQRDYERLQRELEREQSGKPTIWVDVDHPLIYGYGGAGPTTFRYSNRARGNEDADAITYRGGFIGPASFLFDYTDTSDDLSGGTSAYTFDGFFFHNRPLWPNRRLRFQSRPGVFYDRLNMRNAQAGDTKPWAFGFRFELEGEVDVVKLRTFNLSVFANGRVGYGWGRTTVDDVRVDSTSWGWGWEAGVRAQYARIVGSVSYLDRQTELSGDSRINGVEYGHSGPVLMFGMRW